MMSTPYPRAESWAGGVTGFKSGKPAGRRTGQGPARCRRADAARASGLGGCWRGVAGCGAGARPGSTCGWRAAWGGRWPEPTRTGQTGPRHGPRGNARLLSRGEVPSEVEGRAGWWRAHRHLSSVERVSAALDTGPCVLAGREPGGRPASRPRRPLPPSPPGPGADVGLTLHSGGSTLGQFEGSVVLGKNTLNKRPFPGDDVASPLPRMTALGGSGCTRDETRNGPVYSSAFRFEGTSFPFP